MENLTKENVFIRVNTEKKARKLKKVFDMFGENTMSKNTIKLALTEHGLIKFGSEGWYLCSRVYGLTEVTIKQLKQILAKDKLKEGDIKDGSDLLTRIDNIESTLLSMCKSIMSRGNFISDDLLNFINKTKN